MSNMIFGVNLLPVGTTASTFALGSQGNLWDGYYIDNINPNNIKSTIPSTILPTATSADLGAIRIAEGTGLTSQTYGVVLDSDQHAYVGVPWTDEKIQSNPTDNENNKLRFLLKNINNDLQTTNTCYFSNTALEYKPSTETLYAKNIEGTASTATLAKNAINANITTTTGSLAYFSTTAGEFAALDPGPHTNAILFTGTTGPNWRNLTGADIGDGTITTSHLLQRNIGLGTQTVVLGGSLDLNTFAQDLGLNKALSYRGVFASRPEGQDLEKFANGDVIVVINNSLEEGVWALTVSNGQKQWQKLGTSVGYKILQNIINSTNSSCFTTDSFANTYIQSITQDANGNISGTVSSIPSATTADLGLVSINEGITVNSAGQLNIDYGDTVSELQATSHTGTSTKVSRADHVHQLTHKVIEMIIPSTVTTAFHSSNWGGNQYYGHTWEEPFLASNAFVDVNIALEDVYGTFDAPIYVYPVTTTTATMAIGTNQLPHADTPVKIILDKSIEGTY